LPSPNSAPEEETPVYLKGVRSPSQERPGGAEPVGVEPGDVEVVEPYSGMHEPCVRMSLIWLLTPTVTVAVTVLVTVSVSVIVEAPEVTVTVLVSYSVEVW
jgi:hypothetical protein